MPGYRGHEERTTHVVVRLTPKQKAQWTEYAGWEGVSALVRKAVALWISRHPNPQNQPREHAE